MRRMDTHAVVNHLSSSAHHEQHMIASRACSVRDNVLIKSQATCFFPTTPTTSFHLFPQKRSEWGNHWPYAHYAEAPQPKFYTAFLFPSVVYQ